LAEARYIPWRMSHLRLGGTTHQVDDPSSLYRKACRPLFKDRISKSGNKRRNGARDPR
jgi:hypothetical protein